MKIKQQIGAELMVNFESNFYCTKKMGRDSPINLWSFARKVHRMSVKKRVKTKSTIDDARRQLHCIVDLGKNIEWISDFIYDHKLQKFLIIYKIKTS